jgi:hypothetical protein
MIQRIAKLIGQAYSTSGNVHVQGTYNGVEFINGPVSTTVVDTLPIPAEHPPYLNATAQFETTTDITGQIPVVLSVTGGVFYFGHFWMNYTGATWVKEQTNPEVPIDPNDPSTYIWVETVPPIDYYADPNTNTAASDGISNLTKNGVAWNWRTNVVDQLGDWAYPIADGDIITFDFFVDPASIVLISNPPA